ncbi:unnamed protein product [Polarella glacialis]|uniref:catechol O-methyltransferase n=1 Tax=Polarella glacialis TaxID=89957 RepID=A0A813FKD6_POLGL|nr:unnamed protein product [Polarella glacialis]CAE8736743.1 unnamed protein product [Polarella glacialis]
MTAAIRGAPTGGQVLEIGTYCGQSALRMALCLGPGTRIHSLEADPVHMVVARNILAASGKAAAAVQVWTGHRKDLLPRWRQRECGSFAAVFMDQRGSGYDEDLELLESGACSVQAQSSWPITSWSQGSVSAVAPPALLQFRLCSAGASSPRVCHAL